MFIKLIQNPLKLIWKFGYYKTYVAYVTQKWEVLKLIIFKMNIFQCIGVLWTIWFYLDVLYGCKNEFVNCVFQRQQELTLSIAYIFLYKMLEKETRYEGGLRHTRQIIDRWGLLRGGPVLIRCRAVSYTKPLPTSAQSQGLSFHLYI